MRGEGKPGAGATRRTALRGLATLAACASIAACAGRQAVVESDPRGGAEARRQLEAGARSDLDALRRAQTDHFEEAGTYTYDLGALGVEGSAGIDLSVLEATPAGFSAIAAGGSVECALFVGDVAPPRAYTITAGVVACRA